MDIDVDNLCSEISFFLKYKNYSEIVEEIVIFIAIAPDDEILAAWNEGVKLISKSSFIISKLIDFDPYINASIEGKMQLMFEGILSAVKSIPRRAKMDFKLFEKELTEFYNDYMEKWRKEHDKK